MTFGYVSHHVLSQLVQPTVAIAATAPETVPGETTIIVTATPHYFVTGDTVTIAGADDPVVNGTHVVTRIDATSFSIPIETAAATGAVGTVTRTRAQEPLTLDEAKLRAGLDWVAGDPRDALMAGFISAARQKVELDTGLSLLYQVRDVFYDVLTEPDIILPAGGLPLVDVVAITSIDSAGLEHTMPPTSYVLDHRGGRIGLAVGAAWPSDLRSFQPFRMRIVAGWPQPAAVPPLLVHAVGLLTAHYATAGRDLATVGMNITTTPYGYDEAIAPFIQLVLA